MRAAASAAAESLFSSGHAANAAGEPANACDAFERAFVLHPRASLLLSVANMRLKLGHAATGSELYRHVLAAARAGTGAVGDTAEGGVVDVSADGAAPPPPPPPVRFVTPPTDKEIAMATRKEAEAQAALARGTEPPSSASDTGASGTDVTQLDTDVTQLDADVTADPNHGASAAATGAHGMTTDGEDEVSYNASVLWRRTLAAEAEAARSRDEANQLRVQLASTQRRGREDGASAGGSSGGSSGRLAAQIEQLQAELRRAKAEGAQALADKAAMSVELAERQRLQRRAKMGRLREQEKLARLEVKLMTREAAPAESDEMARIREVYQAQSEQIRQLVDENEALRGQLRAAEANR